jgi:hypothetical protein
MWQESVRRTLSKGSGNGKHFFSLPDKKIKEILPSCHGENAGG